jgi:hypothetical protein
MLTFQPLNKETINFSKHQSNTLLHTENLHGKQTQIKNIFWEDEKTSRVFSA